MVKIVSVGVVVLVGVWIYLVWMSRRYGELKVFLKAAGLALSVGIVGTVVHSVLFVMSEEEEAVFVVIASAGFVMFAIATLGGLVVFLRERR